MFSLKRYENREDLMKIVKRDFLSTEIIEEFHKGRNDCLKTFIYRPDETNEVILKFYSTSRFDCMEKLIYHSTFIEEFYDNRRRDL